MNPVSAGRARLWRRAAGWLLLLGPLFYLSYGLANAWAASRAVVPSVVFAWEHHIPFWAWTIIPYWSINVLYALSLFLAPGRHPMDRHGARLLTAQVGAVSCFLLWPLHFSFGQPAADGLPGLLFDALRGFDRPYNQAPSLHIALTVILWDWYRLRLPARAWAQMGAAVWALLIAGSVLTTYQHHFLDIPTGALLGLLCVWLWPLERVASLPRGWRWSPQPRAWKLAGLYLVGALLLLRWALTWNGWALWLCWPAASLALVALNYAALGPRGFAMDRHGRMRWAARWLFAPYRAAAAFNAWCWTRSLPASAEVVPGIRLGRRPSRSEWEAAGRPQVFSLCAELQLPRLPVTATGQSATHCLPMLDMVLPPAARLRRAAHTIEALHLQGQPVWVCCALGFSRSAAALTGWLTRQGRDVPSACAQVRQARPQVVLGTHWLTTLMSLKSTPLLSGKSIRAEAVPIDLRQAAAKPREPRQ
jgi:protein-tyrosine phosphatase